MAFKSIRNLLERAELNAKAAECLGLAGAFSSLPEELNELEAAEYARNLLTYLKDEKKHKEKELKVQEQNDKREEKYRYKVLAREEKIDEKNQAFEKRYDVYLAKLEEVREKNKVREQQQKKLLKEPKAPAPPKNPKLIDLPKIAEITEPPTEPLLPRKVLSQRERIRLQREMLNAYISGHPLDEVPDDDNITKISNLEDLEKGEFVSIRGVLQSLKVTSTRSKKLMAKLRIEDKNGSIEIAVFPRTYEVVQGTLEEGELYKVSGRVDIVSNYDPKSGEEYNHIQVIGTKISRIQIVSDKEWEIRYPLLKGMIRVLPGIVQKSKGIASGIITRLPREKIEEKIG